MNYGFNVKSEMLPAFGDLIGDKNPIHRREDIAVKAGFADTPVFAVMLQMMAEQCAHNSSILRDGLYSNHSFRFIQPVYPDMHGEIKTEFGGQEVEGGDKTIRADIYSGTELAVKSLATFSQKKLLNPNLPDVGKLEKACIDKSQEEILLNMIEDVGIEVNREGMPFMLPASLFSSRLLKMGNEVGLKSGVYLRADFSFHKTPEAGEFDYGVKLLKQRGPLYKFSVACYQNRLPVVSGELLVNSLPEN
ncbi:MAG: MaoC family dehydratase [Nanoarchaeota archaeon]